MRSLWSAMVLAAALCASGCAAQSSAPGAPSPAVQLRTELVPTGGPAYPGHPADLVGLWRVTDAVGGAGDSWLRVDDHSVTVWRTCGVVAGSWRATDRLFAADIHISYGEGCNGPRDMGVQWLDTAEGFEATGDDVVLNDRAGEPVARLIADGSLPPIDPLNGTADIVPVVSPEIRARLEPGLALPPSQEPGSDIVGRWVAEDDTSTSPEQPHVEFFPDGHYTGSDGCNAAGGRWALDDGTFIATAGPSTLAGCNGISVPSWIATAASIGIIVDEADAPVLLLNDASAQPVGRLVQEPTP